MTISVTQPFIHVEDANGNPYSAARLHVYAAGTTTALGLYTDAALTQNVGNPITSDSAGNFPRVFIAAVSYKLRATQSDVTLIWEHDNIDPGVPIGAGVVAISGGGTGASTATTARTNLGAASSVEVAAMASTLAGQASSITTVANRATALETTVNTAVTGNTARIGTLEVTINTAVTGNTARIVTLESTVNTAATGNTARITGLENTRVRFDAAQALNATQSAQARANAPPFASGTNMLFVQTAAPVGWTKYTGYNDVALRVVSGAATSGGSVPFSVVFGRTATDGTSITQAHLPNVNFVVDIPIGQGSHGHPGSTVAIQLGDNGTGVANKPIFGGTTSLSIASATLPAMTGTAASGGSGTAHTHPIDMGLSYVDVIIATKD